MYELRLNNEELFTLRDILEHAKAGVRPSPWNETSESINLKVLLAQIDGQEQEEAEAQAERYARNAHSQPEGL